jgi:hypothetical protein
MALPVPRKDFTETLDLHDPRKASEGEPCLLAHLPTKHLKTLVGLRS